MQNQQKNKIRAGIITILIYAFLIIVMLWIHFRTPIPPYPEGGGGPGMGIEVNLGMDDAGMGEPVDNALNPASAQAENISRENDDILTSEDEESETITEIPEKKKQKSKEPQKDDSKKTQKENIVINEPVLNQKALFPAQPKNNEGNTGTPGQQGNKNGRSDSPLFTGEGDGSGGGTGGGAGTGIGADIGDGISFSLDGRRPSFLKKPEYKGQSEGKVVVEITVDKNGKVTSARPGVAGSTILDEDLLQVAREAALQSKFTPKPDATVQKGKITYRFMLQ